jgi:hypothetical protein
MTDPTVGLGALAPYPMNSIERGERIKRRIDGDVKE